MEIIGNVKDGGYGTLYKTLQLFVFLPAYQRPRIAVILQTSVGAVVLFIGVILPPCCLSAHRAARVNPPVALRQE